jgi:hypothetical protein
LTFRKGKLENIPQEFLENGLGDSDKVRELLAQIPDLRESVDQFPVIQYN